MYVCTYVRMYLPIYLYYVIGGHQPDAGYVFIPSILVTAPHGRQLEVSLRRNVTVSAEIIPSKDNKAADSW